MMARIGFIGLGAIGTPVALNLAKAGHRLTVHDVRESAVAVLVAAGAHHGSTPRDVAGESDVVFTSLPGPAEVTAVACGRDGILEGLARDGVYVDLTTNAPSVVRRIHRAFAERGSHVLDAPLAGRSTLAATRDLMVLVGGDADVFERTRPILDAIGKRVVYCGAIGSGMICKLMHNCINAVFRQAAGECFTVGVKAGVDAAVLWEVVRNGITCGGSEINSTMRNTWLRGEFDTGTGSLAMHHKDTALAVELGAELDVPMVLAQATLDRLREALDRGWGRRDSTSSLILQEERAGVQVRIPDRIG